MNKTDDGFSTTNTPVPPLPPRKSIIGKSPRASKISNTSGELEFALGSNHDPPHISPKIPTIPTGRISTDGDSPRVPPIPAGSPSADGESNSYNSHVLNLADYRNSSTSSHNGQVPAIPGPHSPSGHRSDGLENTPPPIPTRPNRLSNISTASSSSSSSSSHNNQEHESFKF